MAHLQQSSLRLLQPEILRNIRHVSGLRSTSTACRRVSELNLSPSLTGYVQIVDGYTRETNISNRENPGYYCGEIDSPKTFISETPYVKVVFHVDEYRSDTYMHFEANVKQQQEVASR